MTKCFTTLGVEQYKLGTLYRNRGKIKKNLMSKNQFKFKIPFDTGPYDSETYAILESKSVEETDPIFILNGLVDFAKLGKKYLNKKEFDKFIASPLAGTDNVYFPYFLDYERGKLDPYFAKKEVYEQRKEELIDILRECQRIYYEQLYKHVKKTWGELFEEMRKRKLDEIKK